MSVQCPLENVDFINKLFICVGRISVNTNDTKYNDDDDGDDDKTH